MHTPFHIFRKKTKQEGKENSKTDTALVCWICGERFDNPAEYLWHLQVCGVVKERGMPLKYDKSIGAWRLDISAAAQVQAKQVEKVAEVEVK